MDRCLVFLEHFVMQSVTWKPVLGPEEWVQQPTIQSAATLQDVWAALVKVADDMVMQPKRIKDENGQGVIWSLTYSSRYKAAGNKATYTVGQVGVYLIKCCNSKLTNIYDRKFQCWLSSSG